MALRMSSARRLLIVTAVVAHLLTVSWVWASPASAHTQLVASDPPDGATLGDPPEAVTLTFTEVNGTVSIITVHDPSGRPVSTDTPKLAGVDSLRVPLAMLTDPGRYETRYLVTDADGHQIRGILTFTLTAPVASSPSPAVPDQGIGAEPTREGDSKPAWPWLVVTLAAVAAGCAGILRVYLTSPSRRRPW
ncbi:copper resistance CopC family protein [Pseudonocardia kunmingensis]|uniref:CopC domain-containing protein n=1 Tax=Pseudonocardia kunmingensis TaxID=630975 RepID=A0A543CWW8_9PSEU|nr:copper resistance CopC family protein [Pseudonocardia kunmingensis]TQM01607.1 hypothetical protein FB558_8498 [Pseudonocardia kunmingensis]